MADPTGDRTTPASGGAKESEDVRVDPTTLAPLKSEATAPSAQVAPKAPKADKSRARESDGASAG